MWTRTCSGTHMLSLFGYVLCDRHINISEEVMNRTVGATYNMIFISK